MSRPKLVSSSQPLAVQALLRACEFLASLKLAVVLISASAIVLAWATYVESNYGDKAVRFGVYGTWWFGAIVALLGINVLFAAVVRFPWKKYQTGFVVTHAGILVMLLGCLLSRMGGIDASLPVIEETAAHRVFSDVQHLELDVTPTGTAPGGNDGRRQIETIRIPFSAGPFDWRKYASLPWFPWQLAHRDQGVLYDRDGIRLEVLDYYSDSRPMPSVPLKLSAKCRTTTPANATPATAAAKSTAAPAADGWQSIELSVQGAGAARSPHGGMGVGGRQELAAGQQMVFWAAQSSTETEAFRDSRPEGPLGPKGQVVLYFGGKKHCFAVDQLAIGSRVPIGDSGLLLEPMRLDDSSGFAVFSVIARGESPQRMVLLADHPEFNEQDREHGVFGTYWHAPAGPGPSGADEATARELSRLAGRPRIDILQGTDHKLYYRTWKPPHVGDIGEVPIDGTQLTAFSDDAQQVTWQVDRYTPQDRPGQNIEPVEFNPKKDDGRKLRCAKIRLTVDGSADEFWLDGLEQLPFVQPPKEGQRHVVYGHGRRVAVTLPWDEIEIGFRIFLQKFDRRLDPGTSMASHYSSEVDLLPRDETEEQAGGVSADRSKALRKDVLITLNEPVDFADPAGGRSYRLFQASFNGPWKPGDDTFDRFVPSGSGKDQLFMSVLSFNYDPGRGLKYTGSLLIVVGVVIIFYMKAYFFRRTPVKKANHPA